MRVCETKLVEETLGDLNTIILIDLTPLTLLSEKRVAI